jgi:hypothetical protein
VADSIQPFSSDTDELPHPQPQQNSGDSAAKKRSYVAPSGPGHPTYGEMMLELYDPETGLPW